MSRAFLEANIGQLESLLKAPGLGPLERIGLESRRDDLLAELRLLEDGGERAATKLVKVTEVVGEHVYDGDADWISDLEDGSIARLNDMVPEGGRGAGEGGRRGRWRITVEFEPLDEEAASEEAG